MKRIHCVMCGTYLGEIRDGTLKKGMTFMCAVCTERLQRKMQRSKENDSTLPPEFRSLFGLQEA